MLQIIYFSFDTIQIDENNNNSSNVQLIDSKYCSQKYIYDRI